MRITFIRPGEAAQEVGLPNLVFEVGTVMSTPDDLSEGVALRLVKYEWAEEVADAPAPAKEQPPSDPPQKKSRGRRGRGASTE